MKKYNKSKFSIDNLIQNSKFNYVKNLKYFLIAPISIVLIGIICFFTMGFNLGLDFTGGSVLKIYANQNSTVISSNVNYEYNLENETDLENFKKEIIQVLNNNKIETDNLVFQKTEINIGDLSIIEEKALSVKYQNQSDLTDAEIDAKNNEIKQALLVAFGCFDNTDYHDIVQMEGFVGGSASSELLMNSFLAMLVAILLILIYVVFRFELVSGLAAVLALFHDLLIMTSIVIIFQITVNASFIAALVTILGYSINNTIIIFDRIRENIKSGVYVKSSNNQIANASVKETMTRSVFTTITTFITIALVAIIGVADIKNFAFPIAIGILAGFYSSVFITPGLWAVAFKGSKKRLAKVNDEE